MGSGDLNRGFSRTHRSPGSRPYRTESSPIPRPRRVHRRRQSRRLDGKIQNGGQSLGIGAELSRGSVSLCGEPGHKILNMNKDAHCLALAVVLAAVGNPSLGFFC